MLPSTRRVTGGGGVGLGVGVGVGVGVGAGVGVGVGAGVGVGVGTGLAPPKNLAGASLKPLLENPSAAWTKAAFTQVWRGSYPGHTVRTERWRYTEWDNGKQGAQLFDMQADPQELHDLAADPKHGGTMKELKALVAKNWANEYRPAGGKGEKKAAKKENK